MLPFILDIVIANPKRNLFPRLPGVDWLLGITLAGLVSAAPLPANAQVVTQGQLVATFQFGAQEMVYDSSRNRVYATVPASNSVAIIDAQQLQLVKMISIGSNPQGLTISEDGSRLYVANSGATVNGIGIVDLNNLVALPGFTTSTTFSSVFAGLSNRLYALSGSIYMLDATSGSVLGQTSPSLYIYSGAIRGTPDRKTLFYGQFGLSPSSLTRIDISGTNMVIEESISPGSNGQSLHVSPLGDYVVFPNGAPYDIPLFCTTNLNLTYGTFNTGAYPDQAAFDPAERYLYDFHSDGSVGIWDTSTFVQLGSIPVDASYDSVPDMLIDGTGELLFISNGSMIEVRGTGAPPLRLGPSCGASISPTNAVFGTAGGSDSVSVTASNGCAWAAASDNDFITITSGTNGTGNGTVSYTVAANTSTNALTGTMTIAGQIFTVTQSGASGGGGGGGGGGSGGTNCTYTLSATSIDLVAKGGTKTVKVKTSSRDCSWVAVSNDSFITITETAATMVKFSVSGNTNTVPLIGTITIGDQTFTVNQAAGGCTFKLSPKDGKIKAAGGSATVKVTPNFSDCDWTATSNDSFITITGGASGTGRGTVSYTVAANTNTTALTGSITIGGETFTVTQAGAK